MDYRTHLGKDRKLKKLIDQQEAYKLRRRKDVHHYLIASIMSQQLSAKVANTIHQRYLNIYGGRIPLPEEILATPFETLRGIGLSNAKVNYVHNVARFAIEQGIEMGRPSFMGVSVTVHGGKRAIRVSGTCVPVMRGVIEL